DVLRLVAGVGRAEERRTRAAADVDRTAAGILESAAADDNVAAAPFGLHAVGGQVAAVGERAACDPPLMAADHVNRRSVVAPAFDDAVGDGERVDARELDRIAVAGGADVTDLQAVENNVMGRLAAVAAMVDVQPIAGCLLDDQVPQFDMHRPAEMNPRPAPLEDR